VNVGAGAGVIRRHRQRRPSERGPVVGGQSCPQAGLPAGWSRWKAGLGLKGCPTGLILIAKGTLAVMRPMALVALLALAGGCVYGQTADAPSFEVASVKPALAPAAGIMCSGGPGTSDPGIWKCSFVPLGFLITQAYGFQPYQFSPVDRCCQARFDITAKVPAGTTKEQFQLMLQNLLAERFKLTLHHEQKEMPVYELTVGKNGLKMKESAPGAAPAAEDPWAAPQYTMGKDGYPVFPPGRGGLAGGNGFYRWKGFNVTMGDLAKTLSFHLGPPVVDATGLKGNYDIDMYWVKDIKEISESLAARGLLSPEDVAAVAGADSGPSLQRAIQDQLGLKLESKRGPGDIVVIDHVEKVPTEN
jgi:uncharacterized protein (TIGR03435 family)